MMDNGTTVLFVSHSAATVKALCPRAILLNHGELVVDGPASKVLDRYFVLGSLEANAARSAQLVQHPKIAIATVAFTDSTVTPTVSSLQPPFERRVSHRVGTGQARFVECRVLADSEEAIVVETGATLRVQAVLDVLDDCPYEGEVGLVVATTEGIELFAINSFFQGVSVPAMKVVKNVCLNSNSFHHFPAEPDTGLTWATWCMPVQGEVSISKVFAAAGFSVVNEGDRIVPLLFDVPGTVRIGLSAQ